MNYINKTGVSFEKGAKLPAASLQEMNKVINNLVDAVNLMLKGKVDINLEYNDPDRRFTLTQATEAVGKIRRSLGQKIRFRSKETGKYVEYSYVGEDVGDDSWTNTGNWVTGVDLVDGGEF